MVSRTVAIRSFLLMMGVSVALAEGFSSQSSSIYKSRSPSSSSSCSSSSPLFFSRQHDKLHFPTKANPLALVSCRGGSASSDRSPHSVRGGVRYAEASDCEDGSTGVVSKSLSTFGSAWGSLGVVYVLLKAIKRVLPIAMEPFQSTGTLAFSSIQWGLYAATCLFFAYAEGYKGFQLKFSPLVVKRSTTLVPGTKQGNNPLNYILAPLYSMGLMNATKKRLIVSWSVSLGVAMIVALVKRLPPVPRCILDAGVVVGLSWGSLSILLFYLKTILFGKAPEVDACLP